ncbi:hypothetical protein Bbelb_152350 [Branchiostoma belcheri]|nr:hypothetical protein Bbelb_152350 [Branchiostoma belcheri]
MTPTLAILALCVALIQLTTAFPVNSTQIPTMEASQLQDNTPSPPIEMNSQKSTVSAKTSSGMSPLPMDGLGEDVTSLPEEDFTDNPTDLVPSQSQPLVSSSLKPSSTQAPEIVASTSAEKPASLSPMDVSAEIMTDGMETGSLPPASSQDPPIQSPTANATDPTEATPSSEPVFSSSKKPSSTQASTVQTTTKQSTPLTLLSSNAKSTQKSATSLATQHESTVSSVSNNPSTQTPAVPPQIQLSSLPPMEKSTKNPEESTIKPRTTVSSSPKKTTNTKTEKPFPSPSTSKVHSTQRPTTVTMVTEEEQPLLSAVEKQESSTPSTTTLVVATGVGCSVGAGIMSAILSVCLNKVTEKGLPTKKLLKKLRQKAKDQQKKGKDRLEIEDEESGENEMSSLLDKESDLNSLQDKIEKRENKKEPAAVVDMERGGSAYEMSPLLKKGSTFDPFLEKLNPPKVDKSIQTEPIVESEKEGHKEGDIKKRDLLRNGYDMSPLQNKEPNLDSPVQNNLLGVDVDRENSNTLNPAENNDKTPTSPNEESASNSSEEKEEAEKQQLLRDDVKGQADKSLDGGEIAPLLGKGATEL